MSRAQGWRKSKISSPMPMTFRRATLSDCARLAELNHQLIRDEGHRNPMTVSELEQRMNGWLAGEYTAVLFENDGEVVAYALYREEPEEIYLRQLFVSPPASAGLGPSDRGNSSFANLAEAQAADGWSFGSKHKRHRVLAGNGLPGLLLDLGNFAWINHINPAFGFSPGRS